MLNYLTPERCALVVVDIQERLMPVIDNREQVIKNAKILIQAAKTMDIPIIGTTQYEARIGAIVPEVKEDLPEETLDKMEFSCLANYKIRAAINSLSEKIDTLLLCGVETHICVYQTALGGLMADYNIWVPADAVSSRTPHNHATGLDRMREIGVTVCNTEMAVYELLGRAGTKEFKEILPFVK